MIFLLNFIQRAKKLLLVGYPCDSDIAKKIRKQHDNAMLYQREVIEMAKNSKQTSKAVATKASRILKDRRYSKTSKSVAGSALAQAKYRGNK